MGQSVIVLQTLQTAEDACIGRTKQYSGRLKQICPNTRYSQMDTLDAVTYFCDGLEELLLAGSAHFVGTIMCDKNLRGERAMIFLGLTKTRTDSVDKRG